MTKAVVAFIGLGGNLADPVQQIRSALRELAQLPDTRMIQHSSLYQTESFPKGYDDYINAVAKIATLLSPDELLRALQALEDQHGRTRTIHWGPRTLDLDVILYGDRVITEPHLVVPHPGLTQRSTVLVPLLEIEPECCLPSGQKLADFLPACADQRICLLEEEVL